MRSAWNIADRRELQQRVAALRPESRAKWGSMTAPQMVAHLADSLRMALGDLPVAARKSPIRYTPLKQLVIYWLPFPKGVPTAVELITRAPATWQVEIDELNSLLEQFARRDRADQWPDHPVFGRMHANSWGVLVFRHMDHHLRQFGV
jgi:hypothetical protein